jgi:hypothetical protein
MSVGSSRDSEDILISWLIGDLDHGTWLSQPALFG